MGQTETRGQFMRMTEKPITYIIFPAEQQWQQGEGNIVQRCGNGRRKQISAHKPAYSKREQRLKSPQRYEPEEHSDRRAQSNRVGGILELEELPTLVAKPSERVHSVNVTELHSAMEQRISCDRQMLALKCVLSGNG